MAAPTNTSFLTATPLVSIPQTITQRADDAGVTYDIYFQIPASIVVAGKVELGVSGFGDLVTYRPTTTVWQGPASAPTQIVTAQPAGLNKPIQVPVDAGIEYFVKVATNAGNPSPANLTLIVQAAANDAIQSGDIIIPDDTVGFPLAALSGSTDYTVRRFIHPYSSSEQGDILHLHGNTLMMRIPTSDATDRLAFYDPSYLQVSTIFFTPAIGNQPPIIRTNQSTQHFWVGYFNDPTLYAFSIDHTGVSSSVANLGDVYNGIQALTTSPDESIFYFTEVNDSLIRAWDLVNHIALPDFKVAVANHRGTDLLTLSNGDVISGLYKPSATRDFQVRHYSSAGSLLHTYNFGSDIRGVPPRMAHSIDNLTSFWVFIPRDETGPNGGKMNVYQVQISDGTFLTSRTYAMFELGVYRGPESATPLAYLGASNSCPFWVASATPTVCPPNQRVFGCITPEASPSACLNSDDSGFPRTSRCGLRLNDGDGTL